MTAAVRPTWRLLAGDAAAVLPTLTERSAHCIVTSPPYWGLRNYGTPGQLGLEATPEAYLAAMVAVFRLAHRVLRDDGTCWLNMGDCYTDGGRGQDTGSTLEGTRHNQQESRKSTIRQGVAPFGLGRKQMVGMPWRLALALQADGWILRSDIVWAKPNPMPESVNDRPTKAHEYLFLLAKSERYYYDAAAIAEPVSGTAYPRGAGVNPKSVADAARAFSAKRAAVPEPRQDPMRVPSGWDTGGGSHHDKSGRYSHMHVDRVPRPRKRKYEDAAAPAALAGDPPHTGLEVSRQAWRARHGRIKQNASFSAAVADLVATRNKRDVWTVASEPFAGAHFATFPRALIAPCILAGAPLGGTVLDPFAGAGTTLLVAADHQRHAIGIELSPAYVQLARDRIRTHCGLLADEIPA